MRRSGKENFCQARLAERGLTLIELMIVIIILGMVALLLLPGIVHGHPARPLRITCVNNLKQVGLAYHTWALDHNDKYPMELSVTNGGTLEGISSPFMTFRVLSNELSTPKILVCPADKQRSAASDFRTGFNSLQISYFVGVDACSTNPSMFLSGDRNITNASGIRRGIINLTTNQPAGWTDEIHKRQGNIGLTDGSVQQLSRTRLREALQCTGDTRNRVALP